MFTLTALLQCHLLITSDVQKKNESAAASVAGSDWKTDLYHYLVQFLELNALSASASTCKQLYCKFNSELVQRRLCSMMCAKVLDIPLLHYQHSAYSILRRIHPLLLARQEEVNIKCFHLGKRKRRANLHCLSLLPFHFPWPVSEYAQVNQQATSSSSHSASVPQKEVQTSSPFTLLTRDTDSCNVTARLSCIAYFEVNFTTTEKSHFAKEEQHWSIGITNYADNISSTEQLVVAYNHSGKVFKAQHCLANNPYYKFNVNDTVGCGIIYPPLSSNNRGQIFFTRNGELIHTEDLSLAETFGTAWYPFAVSSCYTPYY